MNASDGHVLPHGFDIVIILDDLLVTTDTQSDPDILILPDLSGDTLLIDVIGVPYTSDMCLRRSADVVIDPLGDLTLIFMVLDPLSTDISTLSPASSVMSPVSRTLSAMMQLTESGSIITLAGNILPYPGPISHEPGY